MYILSLDQGTTSSRAILFDEKGQIAHLAQKEYAQHYPQKGWVEHDPMEILSSQLSVAEEVLSKVDPGTVKAMGITNQRETVVAWRKSTGSPIYNAIVWQDQRTAERCAEIRESGKQDQVREITGLMVDPYFSATKMQWVFKNVEGAVELAAHGDLCIGTVDSWLLWNLTGTFATDISNASRTMLMDLRTGDYSEELLQLFEIPPTSLAPIHASDHEFGEASLANHKIPIHAVIGDQQAALFGQMCWSVGEVKNTYGTGCFMLMNTGDAPPTSNSGLLSTVAWKRRSKTTYALEGSVFVAGAAIQWLRDELGFLTSAEESEEAVAKASEEGVFVVPAFAGLGTPYWDDTACGAIFGLTRSTNKHDIIKATLDSMAFQTHDVLRAMEKDAEVDLRSMRVDGGASANNYLMQFQSDILNIEIQRPQMLESTAWGAALMAGLSTGFWTEDGIKEKSRIDGHFTPKIGEKERSEKLLGWLKAVDRCKHWYV